MPGMIVLDCLHFMLIDLKRLELDKKIKVGRNSPDDIDKRLFAPETDCAHLPCPRPFLTTAPPIRCAEGGAGPDHSYQLSPVLSLLLSVTINMIMHCEY